MLLSCVSFVRASRINNQCFKAPSIGLEKRVRSTLVLAGRHLIATIYLISNTFDKFVISALILSGTHYACIEGVK